MNLIRSILACACACSLAPSCVDDSEVTPRRWTCLTSRGEEPGQVGAWSASYATVPDEGAAEAECEAQSGLGSNCAECALDEGIIPESAPYACTCGATCHVIGPAETSWHGPASSKIAAEQECLIKLGKQCSIDLREAVWSVCR